jgi:hypothetical protein
MRAGPPAVAPILKTAWQAPLIGLAIVGAFAMTAAATSPPAGAERLAVVFPPWWSHARIAAAGASAGDIAGAGSVPFILVLRSEHAGLGARSRQAGGLLLLDPAATGACAPPLQESRA